MPIYEYRCNECGQVFEEWQRDFTERQLPCPVCKGDSGRIMSNTSFVLKGGGWYVTDYCKNGETASAACEPGKACAAKDGGDSAPAASTDGPAAKPAASPCAGGCAKACTAAN